MRKHHARSILATSGGEAYIIERCTGRTWCCWVAFFHALHQELMLNRKDVLYLIAFDGRDGGYRVTEAHNFAHPIFLRLKQRKEARKLRIQPASYTLRCLVLEKIVH